MKQRFSSLDVKVICQELASELVNLRVSNIYDLSSRIFLFKLAKPDHRKQLVVDSGFRCHVTQYSRATATAPSPFVTRMRKFLKSRRLTSIEQIGTDRVIDFSFSDGMYHMFLEFFAGGNIIITDREYNILTLFRQVPAGVGEEEMRVGLKYTVTNKQNYHGVPEITLGRIKATLEKAKEASAQEGTAPKKSKKKNVDVLRKALSQGFPEYPPLLLDHAFAVKEVDPATPLEKVLGDDALMEQVNGVLKEAQSVTIKLSAKEDHPGYIVVKEDKRPTAESTAGTEETSPKAGLLYEDFHPFRPRQFDGKPGVTILEFSTFNATVDEYFSSLETQKLESRLTEREEAAKRKLDAVRQEHEKRLGALKQAQEIHVRKAAAIEDNVYRVQEAMDAVNGLIAQGMDWVEIARLIEMEQGRGNPVAQIIKLPLKLYENTITLVLGEASEEQDAADDFFSDESEEESESEEQEAARKAPEMLTIDIDLGLSPWANATQYYEQKKMAAVKEQKTAQSSTKALKSHEKKVTEDLKRSLKQEKQVLRPARKPFWFEKFLFFISSEGYLVLGGRDAMQSELLYRRHLKKGDIFVHADLEGARPMIVKNRPGTPDAPIPPSTLSQAGNLCVATSSAWESKAVMAAWWVNANQVTKTTTGGLLPTGEFEVKGEKNFLAPSPLVLGFAVMFQISKESLKNHKIHIFEDATPTEPLAKEDETTKQPAENEQSVAQEPGPAGADKPAANGSSEQENESSSESDEEVNPDSIPPRNPLQRGVSEPLPEQEGTSEGPRSDEKEDESEVQGEAAQAFQEETAAEEAESPEEKAATSQDISEPSQLSKEGSVEPATDSKEVNRTSKATANGVPAQGKLSSSKKATPAPAKGKKGKGKKGADKYAHQDEEERELALRLVGAKSAKAEKAAAAAAAKAQREREAEAQKQRRKAQHERAAEAERRRQALFDEGAADDYNEETAAAEAADLAWIPALIGTPRPEDEILAAIPICAPWAALGRYKYRVKLQPGTVKKGKAVKEILGRWVAETTTGKVKKEQAEEAGISIADAEKLRAREGELFKAWKDTEIINTVPVPKVRIMTGGGATGGDAKGKGKGGSGGNKGGKGGKKK
ncbi:nuclear export mediator factor Nemf [Aspergillus lentulus]|uniref:Nuclear export mediator factor Nemf n=1 Tax=Aspergillus lentulus TaxID=293939 RepID=A0ABQ0ZVW2_ASPLE|nr:nuclear export mediator factor Nemf [Aspergillus lentulus]GFF34380.1 nuclear export mediator factor Nemf [Aspergillus lentulus]GFF50077.1 nuclear export mediator factor Nemf [Aspergillus lentulus]GFF66112.1 nuclear export mediator factor Nemf [Aspergillus lentulus]